MTLINNILILVIVLALIRDYFEINKLKKELEEIKKWSK